MRPTALLLKRQLPPTRRQIAFGLQGLGLVTFQVPRPSDEVQEHPVFAKHQSKYDAFTAELEKVLVEVDAVKAVSGVTDDLEFVVNTHKQKLLDAITAVDGAVAAANALEEAKAAQGAAVLELKVRHYISELQSAGVGIKDQLKRVKDTEIATAKTKAAADAAADAAAKKTAEEAEKRRKLAELKGKLDAQKRRQELAAQGGKEEKPFPKTPLIVGGLFLAAVGGLVLARGKRG